MTDNEDSLAVRAAWLHYVGGFTQSGIFSALYRLRDGLVNDNSTEITEAGAVSEALTIVTDAQEQSIRYGDANCDGKVNASDASYILRSLVGLDSLSAQGYKNANVDGQSGVSAADASCILRYLVGLLPSLPAE